MKFVCGLPASERYAEPVPTGEEFDDRSFNRAEFGIEMVETIFGASVYRWPLGPDCFIEPDDFTDRLGGFYGNMAARHCPPSLLLTLRAPILFRNVVFLSDDQEWRPLHETFRPNDRAAIDPISAEDLARATTPKTAGAEMATLYLGSAGSFNYGHWLVDDLPRAKAAVLLMQRLGRRFRVLLPSYAPGIDQIRQDSLRSITSSALKIAFIDPTQPYHFPSLYYVTPVSDHPVAKSPAAIDYLSRRVLAALDRAAPSPHGRGERRLYVVREKSHGRTLLNEAEVRQALASIGFEAISPQRLTFRQQAELFSEASTIVGPMGAAMTNTMFSRPAALVVHLAPREWIEPFYLDLAATRGHRYRVLYGKIDSSGRPPHECDYSIDIGSLMSALTDPRTEG